MITQHKIVLAAYPRGFHLITQEVERQLPRLPQQGMLSLLIQHTSAGITLNENADPSVRDDFQTVFNRLVPEKAPYYTHTFEGSDDMPAHIKASLVGFSLQIPISHGTFNLGTWQGIYLCEFRNQGGRRTLIASIYS